MSLPFREKTPASTLRTLYPQYQKSEKYGLSIIIVPDLPTKTPKTAVDSAWSQLRGVLSDVSVKPLIVGFEYGLPRDVAVWTFLQSQSEVLVKCILSSADSLHLFSRPLLFVAQGLGGLVVKQALINVYAPYLASNERRVRDVHQGTVFFSTPHPTYSRRDDWVKLNHILKVGLHFDKSRILEAELERTIVANISNIFEQRITETPVLSICETKATKISTGFFDSSKFVLVDETFAATGVVYEEIIAVNLDHHDIFRLVPKDKMFARIRALLKNVSSRKLSQSTLVGNTGPEGIPINDELEESSQFSGELVEEPEELGPASNEAVVDSIIDRSSSELPTLVEFASQEKTLQVPLHLLKPAVQNPHFFGREEVLSFIDEKLLPQGQDQSTQRAFALCGLGGVGKTQVAIQYAFSRQDKFDVVFWIDSDQPTQLSEGFSVIAAHLGHSDSPDQDRVVSRNIALEWLCNPKKRGSAHLSESDSNATWLLIFNNVDDLEHIRVFWPQCNLGSILITSRDPLAKRNRDGLDLEPFQPSQAAELLRRLLKLSDTEENVDISIKLSIKLGGLPLAITQVAALIERWDMTLEEFLAHFESQTSIARVAKHKPASDTHDYYQHSLFTVWALESLIPGALALLQVMAFLSPDAIQESLLRSPSVTGRPIGFPTTEDDFIDARTDLIKVSLIKRHKSGGARRGDCELTLHRLVQDVARAQMEDGEQKTVLNFAIRLLLRSWPGEVLRFDHDSSTWEISEGLLPHILKIHTACKVQRPYEGSLQAVQDYARLLLFTGWYLLERSDFEAAKPLFIDVLSLCQLEPIAMINIRADVLFVLSALSAQINENIEINMYYAKEHYNARLQLRDGTQLAEDRMAMAYGELAHIQMIAGQHDEAIRNAQMGIEMTWQSPLYLAGDDWPTFAHAHQSFSLTDLGRYEEALKLVHATLKYWNSRSSSTHAFALGITFRVLGYIKKKQGYLEESRDAYLSALKHFKECVGEKSHYTSQCCRNLGFYHLDNGNYETSGTYFEQAIRGYRTHECYKDELAWSLYGLSQTQSVNGDDSRATGNLSEAKSILQQRGVAVPLDDHVTSEFFEKQVALPAR